jgi:hypothetical protein
LGEPGAGKTALLLRGTLRLLQARDPAGRVPVLLRLSSWNPDEQTLEQWIANQLASEYGCRSPVALNRLLPLLDGLDEMPAVRRVRALQAISSWGVLQFARPWWHGRNELPCQLMQFLADAHRRGVLRQAGGVYQFGHALLRDRLGS